MGVGRARTRRSRTGRWLVAGVAAAAVALAATTPAEAYGPPAPEGRFDVAPGVVREAYRVATDHGTVRFQVLRLRPDDPRVSVRPELSRGRVAGYEPTDAMLRRLGFHAVAGVNASFRAKAPGPAGDPYGLVVRDGAHLSSAERPGRKWRGAFGIRADGSAFIGTPVFSGVAVLPDGTRVPLSGVNRVPVQPSRDRPDVSEAIVLAPPYGPSTGTPRGTVEVIVRDISARLDRTQTGTVVAVSTAGNAPIARGTAVLSGVGARGRMLGRLRPGQAVTIELDAGPDWEDVREAVGAGPIVIRDGVVVPRDSWFDEGFGEHHNLKTHPRTVVGFTGDGEMLLVTIDGRRSGHSVGMTTAEVAHLMQHLGVRDAVMMDGGGSTTMAVDGRIVNRPCCDSPGYRAVSDSLVVTSNVPTPDIGRVGGASRYTIAANLARAGWKDGAPVVVLASGDSFSDAMVAAPLAASRQAPLLLTTPTHLPAQTAAALERLGTRRVIVVGATSTISDGVLGQLARRGYETKRIAGRSRTETAARVAWYVDADPDTVFVLSAVDWRQSPTAPAAAATLGAPIVTVVGDEIDHHAIARLRQLDPREVVVVGDTQVVGEPVVTELRRLGFAVSRIGGGHRIDSAVEVAEWLADRTGMATDRPLVARAIEVPVILATAPLAARQRRPLLLVHPLDVDRASKAVRGWLERHDTAHASVIGNPSILSTWVAHELQAVIAR